MTKLRDRVRYLKRRLIQFEILVNLGKPINTQETQVIDPIDSSGSI